VQTCALPISLGHLRQTASHDLARRLARDVGADHAHGALRRADDAADRVEQRGLAGAVRAYERDALACAERQRDTVDGDGGPVTDDELLDLDERGHSDAE